MNTDSFSDEQLLNLVNNTILEKTDYSSSDFTGGAVQVTTAYKNKVKTVKVILMFGYDSNNNSQSFQHEIDKDTYYIWTRAILLKTDSMLLNKVGDSFNELNRLMKSKNQNVSLDNKIEIKDIEIVDRGRTNVSTKHSTNILVMTDSEKSAMLISDYLFRKILTNQPNFKSNTNVWSKDIDRAIRLDKRTEEQLRDCIDWIYSDEGSFWIPNIQSGKKLREKFNTMEAQMISKKNNSTTIVDKLYDNGMSAQDMIKEMEKRA